MTQIEAKPRLLPLARVSRFHWRTRVFLRTLLPDPHGTTIAGAPLDTDRLLPRMMIIRSQRERRTQVQLVIAATVAAAFGGKADIENWSARGG
jgi:hypothetical protein